MNRYLLILVPILVLPACASLNSAITEGDSQVLVRQMQTRVYESLDKGDTLRSVLATLQDLGFVIDTADYEMATITATRLQEYELRVTVTVKDRNSHQLAVRARISGIWSCGGVLGACAAEGARVQAPIQSRWLRCETLLGFTTAAVPRLASGLSRRLGHARPLPRRLLGAGGCR